MRSELSRIQLSFLTVALLSLGGGTALAQAPPNKGTPAATPPPPPSLSDSLTGMAKAELEAAKILYGVNDYANAIVKFRHAYELSSDVRLLWNIAACERSLLHYTRALAALERYLAEGGEAITEQNRADARAFTTAVKTLISTLKILVSEPGADVYIDDEKVGTSPLTAAVLANLGDRKIRVEKAGFKKLVETRQLEGGTEVTIVLRLEKEIHRGQVLIEAGPRDLIALDGKVVAQARWEGSLPSGGHALRVTAPGMVPYQGEIVVQDSKTRRIPVSLTPAAKPGDTATWVWLASGAAVLAGAAIGGALLFKPTYTPGVEGTLDKNVPLSFRGW